MSIPDMRHVWPEWKIEKQIGRGTYGTVWQAVRQADTFTSRAAIKRISIPQDPYELESLRSDGLDLNASRTYLKRMVDDFVNEIRLMESFKGIQNIVSIEDYKVIEHTDVLGWDIYIRMELLTPFSVYLCDKILTEEEVISLGIDICTALEYCARRNIIHRDIKPENIFVNSFGSFKLGDFGTARNMESLTGGLSQKGTFNYMAPEVIGGSDYDARVDVYSLGLVLYRLLNGNRLPFLSEKQLLSPAERRNAFDRRIRGEQFPAPAAASEALAQVILKACAFRPEDRYENAAQMRRALQAISLNRNPVFIQPPKPRPAPEVPRAKAAPVRVEAPEMVVRSGYDTPKKKEKASIRVEAPEMVVHSGYDTRKKKNKAPSPARKIRFSNPWIRTFIAAALILLVFTGSGALIGAYQTHPTALEVTALPDKVQYAPGEILDTEGLILTATGRNGMAKTITDGYRCDISQLSTSGIQEVTVSYRGAEAKFHVAVGDVDALSIVTMPDKTVYAPGENVDPTGLTLGYWNKGKFKTVAEGFSYWPMTLEKVGSTEITVYYRDLTTTFTVSVPTIESITISRLPDTTTYLMASSVDTRGMVLDLNYSDGSTVSVTEGFTCSPRYLGEVGVHTITIDYQGHQTSYPVSVCTITDLEIQTLPDKLKYVAGDHVDTTGLTLIAEYSDGTCHQVTRGYNYQPRTTYTAGTKVVTVTYEGLKTSYDIQVETNPDNMIENFHFDNLTAICTKVASKEYNYGMNSVNQEVNWCLIIDFDMSLEVYQNYDLEFEASWTDYVNRDATFEEHFKEAKRGITGGSFGFSPPIYGGRTGRFFLEILLPDDPTLEGPQYVTLYLADQTVTVTFDLSYHSNYDTGLGWRVKNVDIA